ncbi:hypothetical protein M878_29785 [Streptomyces roseochromogenus subsp. oscitans DS 12.976]|uniref:Uncharacterized protein n=1 Tax=Streptomyces roseochromogenus subsp. oscitans DS 12.976 TaxID=1352936 RepID=V6K0B9_STRRC|nr:hypothetical protein M878_29785 [Streptomyces roseochromogenus subsp. oscitans DS 12.976]
MQNPSVRPGLSPRARPTGAPQSEREQNRFRSGTSGFSSTIARGSGRGTCGTCTSPAPSRPRVDVPEEEPELRTDTDRPLDRPDSERESRPDTDRRDFDDCEDVRELCEPRELPLSTAPLVSPVGSEPTMPPPEGGPPAATTGARPQVSQYSSPPPTSSYDPSQSGR